MDLRFIAPLMEGEKEYHVYYDDKTEKYYKIFGDEKIELTGEEELNAKLADKCTYQVVSSKQDKKFKKNFKKLAVLLLAGALLYAPIVDHKEDIKYVAQTQSYVGDYQYLRNYQGNNETLSYDLQIKLPQYIEVLSRLGVKESRIVKIGNRLRKGDFTGLSEIEVITRILGLDDNGFVANELYAYINGTPVPYKQAILTDLFTLEKDAARRLVNGESIDKLVKEMYGVKINSKNLSDKDIEAVRMLGAQIADSLGFVDGTQGYGLNNNIFEEYVRIGFGTHNFYGKQTDEGLENMTQSVYMKKLTDLVYGNAKFIDYQNQDDRFIVYLYANSLLFGEFFNMDIEIPALLYSGVIANKDNVGYQVISQEELYSYLEDPALYTYDNIHLLCQLAYYGEYGIYILQETNLCLLEDLKVGNITQAQYDMFIDAVLTIYSENYPELVDVFRDAALKNKSIDGFQIQLINPEVY